MAESKVQIFNHLKIHSQYSICEGAIKIDDLKDFSKENKIRSLALCDSVNLCGALEFAEKISKVGTQPIIGTQINFKYADTVGQLPLYALNEKGYKRIIELSSLSYLKNDELSDPHLDLSELFIKHEGVSIFSGTINGLFGRLFDKGKFTEIVELYTKLKENFNNRFYLEIQRHGDQNELNFEKFNLSKSLEIDIPLIATNEVFYLEKEMHEAHDALICIKNKTYVNDKDRPKLSKNHNLKSDKEMLDLFADLPEALLNNYYLPYKCSFKANYSKPLLPEIVSSNDTSSEKILETQAIDGLNEKFNKKFIKIDEDNNKGDIYKKYKERLLHEIKIINQMNYSSYFLIVSDYIKWAKNNDIPVGPGRGSGAGSLVAWCLSITDVDPLKFNPVPSLFLDEERVRKIVPESSAKLDLICNLPE